MWTTSDLCPSTENCTLVLWEPEIVPPICIAAAPQACRSFFFLSCSAAIFAFSAAVSRRPFESAFPPSMIGSSVILTVARISYCAACCGLHNRGDVHVLLLPHVGCPNADHWPLLP